MPLDVRQLIDLVKIDYVTNGKRTLGSVVSHSKHLLRYFDGQTPTARDVECYKADRRGQGAAASTISNELTILRFGFRLALRRGLIDRVPEIVAPRIDNVPSVTCSLEEIETIFRALDALDPAAADLVRWLVITGWRNGEGRGLGWRDVSSKRDRVILPQARSKNRRPRDVALGIDARQLLDRRWSLRDGDFVFQRNGRKIIRFRGAWRRAVEGAGVPELRPHDCRRLFAQLGLDADVPIPTLMAIAGWETMSSFLRYGLRNSKALRDGQDRIGGQLRL